MRITAKREVVMRIKSTIAVGACAVVLVAAPVYGQEQQKDSAGTAFVVDKELAKAGKSVWSGKGCLGCHTIGKGALVAPDLNGLYERRKTEWIREWMTNPEAMYASDADVKAMVKEWNGLEMPNLKLKDAEIEAVMHYIGEQQIPQKK